MPEETPILSPITGKIVCRSIVNESGVWYQMYLYCISYYQQYSEAIFCHEKQFTEKEFELMVKKSKYSGDYLCENFGFNKIKFQAHYCSD